MRGRKIVFQLDHTPDDWSFGVEVGVRPTPWRYAGLCVYLGPYTLGWYEYEEQVHVFNTVPVEVIEDWVRQDLTSINWEDVRTSPAFAKMREHVNKEIEDASYEIFYGGEPGGGKTARLYVDLDEAASISEQDWRWIDERMRQMKDGPTVYQPPRETMIVTSHELVELAALGEDAAREVVEAQFVDRMPSFYSSIKPHLYVKTSPYRGCGECGYGPGTIFHNEHEVRKYEELNDR